MKKYILFTIILIAFTTEIFAQKKSNDNFNTFWKIFKTALKKDDKIIIANLTNYPFQYIYTEIKTKEEFLKRYDSIFPLIFKKEFIKKNLEKYDHNYYLVCYDLKGNILKDPEYNAVQYSFSKIGNAWKLIQIYPVGD